MRNALEAAITLRMTETYRYSNTRLEFQKITGVETAVNCHIRNSGTIEYTEVLSLKSAYSISPPDKFMTVVRQKLPANMSKMIALTL